MSLHILHHKSWHVWNRDNIERVKRDEAQHEQEQALLLQRRREREAQHRYETLKRRAEGLPELPMPEEDPEEEKISLKPINKEAQAEKQLRNALKKGKKRRTTDIENADGISEELWKRRRGEEEKEEDSKEKIDSGLDFFQKLEHESVYGVEEEAKEVKREEKKEIVTIQDLAKEKLAQEERRKQLGIGKGATNITDKADYRPWYHKEVKSEEAKTKEELLKKERSERNKNRLDPMAMMDKVLDKQRELKEKLKKEQEENRRKNWNHFSRRNPSVLQDKPQEKAVVEKESKKEKKEKKEKKSKKEKKGKEEKKPTIEELRAQRMEREKKEREKVAAMIYSEEVEMGSRTPYNSTPRVSQNERENPYHNQYYPSPRHDRRRN